MITEKQRQLLAHLEFSPSLAVPEIAKRVGQKSSSVSYLVRQLWEEGLVNQRAFVNAYALGFSEVAIYFSLTEQTAEARQTLFQKIVEHDRVIFFGSLLGDYHYVIVFLCRSLNEIQDFMRELFVGSGDLFSDKLVAPRLSSNRYPRKYFAPNLPRHAAITAQTTPEITTLDDLDTAILHRIGNHGFDSLRSVAREIGSPFSTVERRVDRLVKNQVISGFYLNIAESALGVQFFRLLIAKKAICSSTRDRLFQFCEQHPQVVYLIEALGAWDYEIGIEVNDSEEVTKFIEELHGICSMRIAWLKALMEGKSYKCSRFPFRTTTKVL